MYATFGLRVEALSEGCGTPTFKQCHIIKFLDIDVELANASEIVVAEQQVLHSYKKWFVVVEDMLLKLSDWDKVVLCVRSGQAKQEGLIVAPELRALLRRDEPEEVRQYISSASLSEVPE